MLPRAGTSPCCMKKNRAGLAACSFRPRPLLQRKKDRELIEWYRREVARQAIEVHLNTEVTDLAALHADEVIIATGAAPKKPPIPGLEHAMEAAEYLCGREVGERVVIIGGGLTGCEIAYDLILKGKKPIVVEMKNDLIAARGVCLANSSFLRETLALHETSIYLETSVKAIRPDGVTLCGRDGKNSTSRAIPPSFPSAMRRSRWPPPRSMCILWATQTRWATCAPSSGARGMSA